jgi:putative cell wall-binding protein
VSRRRASELLAALAIACVFAVLAGASPARAWFGDFFDGDTSGQAIFEDSYIHAESLYADGVTYIAYQGALLDPYVVTYNHSTKQWSGPFKVGSNTMTNGSNPDDTHGAPAIFMDSQQFLHVFWGAHGSPIRHAKSMLPRNPAVWQFVGNATARATYPQVFRTDDGVTHLFYRNDERSATLGGYHGWAHRTSADNGSTWTTPTAVVSADATSSWYARFSPAPGGHVNAAMVAYDADEADPYGRYGVYFMRGNPDGTWVNARGASLTSSAGVPPTSIDMAATATVYAVPGQRNNEVIATEDSSGRPGVLFLSGDGADCRFVFARWNPGSSTWSTSTITATNHFMNAGTVIEDGPGHLTAYLTTAGSGGPAPGTDRYKDRGGDIQCWTSADGGASWTFSRTVMRSTDPGLVYNDPAIVRTLTATSSPESRLVFCEWDNDATNFFHKVFLAGDTALVQREFFPRLTRLSGPTRYETSVAVSKRSFPLSADTAVIVSGEVFADALSAAPFAHAYYAPVLLSARKSLPLAVRNELKRLRVSTVYVVGGPSTLDNAVINQLRAVAGVKSVVRITGKDRYDLAARIARLVAERRGPARTVVLASGERFPDALSASAVAACKWWPILLTKASVVPSATANMFASLQPSETIVVGGFASIESSITSGLPAPVRIGGNDRYEVSANMAEFAFSRGMKVDRFGVASGEVFTDALAAGPMLARSRGPLLLGTKAGIPAPVEAFLDRRATSVLDAFMIGGTATLGDGVGNDIASALFLGKVE